MSERRTGLLIVAVWVFIALILLLALILGGGCTNVLILERHVGPGCAYSRDVEVTHGESRSVHIRRVCPAPIADPAKSAAPGLR
jgi:hypothetical protein